MADAKHILWGITGSVAAIRSEQLAEGLLGLGQVQAMATRRARHFLSELPAAITCYGDEDEWTQWNELGDPVLHIELRRWADVLLIAPATADCLAKLSNGICDTLLLSVGRAWDFSKPVVVAPAMNTMMWEHPTTAEHLSRLRSWGVHVVDPVEKRLACDDVGMGAQAPAAMIVARLEQILNGAEKPPAHARGT